MWRVFALAALLCVVGCVASLPAPVPRGPFVATPEVALAPLLWSGDRRCNAVAVGPTRLVTAAHCVDGDQLPRHVDGWTWARSNGWSPLDRVVVARADEKRDYAVLHVHEPRPSWLRVRHMRRGERAAAVVWRPDGWRLLIDESGEPGYFGASVLIMHGDSGSPVIAEDGSLLGVVTQCVRKHGEPSHTCSGGGKWRPLGGLL
jgi:hypothetical protein